MSTYPKKSFRSTLVLQVLFVAGCSVLAACTGGTRSTNPDALYQSPAGYMQNHSSAMYKYPGSAVHQLYLHEVWKVVNQLDKKESLTAPHDWTATSGFKAHTIRITFTISASGELTIIDTTHPENTPKRQVKKVTRMLERVRNHLPPFPAELIEKGETSVTDTMVFIFT